MGIFGPEYDGVIEAVHYGANGIIEWVRAYERRGAAFSDCVRLPRSALIARLEEGKRFVAGRRIPQMAGTFDVSIPVRMIREAGQTVLVTGYLRSPHDHLEGIPEI
jgi:hypothetical protein